MRFPRFPRLIFSKLSIIKINKTLTKDEIIIMQNRAKNYTIDDVFLERPKRICNYVKGGFYSATYRFNLAENLTIDDIYLIGIEVMDDIIFSKFYVSCYRKAYMDYMMEQNEINILIQEIIKYEDYEKM